jgi:F0F1-type ATP synthase membrane subunit c/vacuolar-type H+-ATPase subunit K
MEAMGRQPEILPKLQVAMIIGFGFAEALTIYAFVTMFFLQGRIG